MRALALAAALVCAAAGSAPAHDAYGPRGLNGSTLTTSRIDPPPPDGWAPRGPGGMPPATALIFPDPRFQNRLPACDDPGQLEAIRQAFAEKESQFWASSLVIVGFDRVRVTASNPWGQNNIPRRYCVARAHLSDGRARTVDYAIMEGQGMIGASYGVEWCVRGLDRGRSFDPSCRMARP